jgi:hypothetical protein
MPKQLKTTALIEQPETPYSVKTAEEEEEEKHLFIIFFQVTTHVPSPLMCVFPSSCAVVTRRSSLRT